MDPFIGEIRMFGGNFAPNGWALCNGQLLSINQYAALFSLLGTSFGGNGSTTFGLPDLQGRVPLSWGQGSGLSNYNLGDKAGTETITLTQNQMPAHNHLVNSSNIAATAPTAGANLPATPAAAHGQTPLSIYGPVAAGTMGPTMIAPAGGSLPHANIQPYLALTFIIALVGIFPSRP
jgi:microcystin-dependent protein